MKTVQLINTIIFKMKSLYNLISFFAILEVVYGQMCFPDEYTCANLSCIPQNMFCDGNDDCGDRSDEPEGCTPCPVGYWQCKNGNCIPETYECDGEDDCDDGSDEHENCPPCPIGMVQCPNGKCIYDDWICDGDNDCGDWSDEPEDPEKCPPCPIYYWRCSNGRCVHQNYVCDGYNGCGDWSDETEEACPCADGELRCPKPGEGDGPPGNCIPPEYVCDSEGIWDCTDGSDEGNCTIGAASTSKVHKVNIALMQKRQAVHKKVSKSKKGIIVVTDSRKRFLKGIAKKLKTQKLHWN